MSQREFKYLLLPGCVPSFNDADQRYINAKQLVLCYQLGATPVVDVDIADPSHFRRFTEFTDYVQQRVDRNYVLLTPRYAGDYMEHRAEQEAAVRTRLASDIAAMQGLLDQLVEEQNQMPFNQS